MKTQLSIQERLKDLRMEKELTLEQLYSRQKFRLPRLVLTNLMIMGKYPTGISLTWQSSMKYQPTICLV
ncbi:hypothetical protein AALB53_19585 [Lachnospiraceae bacterium 47-T17]